MSLTIVGLGFMGSSLGLALKTSIPEMVIIGHDPDPERAALSVKRGATDKTHWNLPAACEQADIVILDLPHDQVAPTLQVLADSLAENALVIDLSLAKRDAQTSAVQLLPPSLRFIGAYIVPAEIVSPISEPSATILKDAMFYLAVSSETSESTIHTAVGLASAVGAKPCFTAPDELDSLIAAGSQLPFITALALMSTWQDSGGWRDRQNALSASTLWVKQFLASLPDAQMMGLWQNRDMLTTWLDNALVTINSLRDSLQAKDSSQLDGKIARVRQQADTATKAEQQKGAGDHYDRLGIRQLLLGNADRQKHRKS